MCFFYRKDYCQPMKTFETNHVVYTHTHTYEGGDDNDPFTL
jgi:hypothetical protein